MTEKRKIEDDELVDVTGAGEFDAVEESEGASRIPPPGGGGAGPPEKDDTADGTQQVNMDPD